MPDYEYVTYETLDTGRIARIMLNRVESRNAQNRGLLVELNDAFLTAESDDQIRVVILGGAGPMFSSGHDLGSKASIAERTPGPTSTPRSESMAGRAPARSGCCSRSGTTSSRTPSVGAICARSPSRKSTAPCTPLA